MKRLLSMLVALLCACESETPPEALHILSITPTEQTSAESKTISVQLDTEPRFFVDYGKRSARMLEQPTLRIGPRTVLLERYLGHGQFEGTVGSGLEVGVYDIQVSMGDGREATLAQAYRVKPSVGFWIESIGHQLQDQPFTITIHAAGPDAALFEGTVMVSLYKGQGNAAPTPFRSGPFSRGVRREQLTIDTPGGNFLVLVQDDEGNMAVSNAFRVDPKI